MWVGVLRGLDFTLHGLIAVLGLAAAVAVVLPTGQGGGGKIRVGLNWAPETEHCGFFQAEAQGLYRKAGLDVQIVSGGPDVNLPLLVASGRMDLALGTSFTTLNMLAGGVDAFTVAAYFQKDPQTLVAHSGQHLRSLEDLRGRPIMVGNFAREEFWKFLKQRFQFTDDQLRPYDTNPAAFLADPTTAIQGYVTQDGVVLGSRMRGPMVSFLLADYGFDNYSQTVFGMRRWIEAHREQVRRFVKATAQGYRECVLGDPRIAMGPILERNPEHGAPLYYFKQKQMRDLGMVTGGDAARLGVGAMTDARWRNFFQAMVAAGIYSPKLDYRRAYTLEFLDQGRS